MKRVPEKIGKRCQMSDPTDVVGCHLMANDKTDLIFSTLDSAVALDVNYLSEIQHDLFLRWRKHTFLPFQSTHHLILFAIFGDRGRRGC